MFQRRYLYSFSGNHQSPGCRPLPSHAITTFMPLRCRAPVSTQTCLWPGFRHPTLFLFVALPDPAPPLPGCIYESLTHYQQKPAPHPNFSPLHQHIRAQVLSLLAAGFCSPSSRGTGSLSIPGVIFALWHPISDHVIHVPPTLQVPPVHLDAWDFYLYRRFPNRYFQHTSIQTLGLLPCFACLLGIPSNILFLRGLRMFQFPMFRLASYFQ